MRNHAARSATAVVSYLSRFITPHDAIIAMQMKSVPLMLAAATRDGRTSR